MRIKEHCLLLPDKIDTLNKKTVNGKTVYTVKPKYSQTDFKTFKVIIDGNKMLHTYKDPLEMYCDGGNRVIEPNVWSLI